MAGLKILSDNHVHSHFSRNNHGKGSLSQQVEAARAKGLKRIIITDHGPGHLAFGLKRENIPKIRRQIDQLNKEYEDIEILFGVEANILDSKGRIDIREEEFKYFDWIALGFHNGIRPRDFKIFLLFYLLGPLAKYFKFLDGLVKSITTPALIGAVRSGKIDVITHPGEKFAIDLADLAEACQDEGVALEINSSHGRLTEKEVETLLDTGVKFSIGSDSHRPEDVGKLDQAEAIVAKLGLDESRIVNICQDK